jgi:hypothetical protein
MKLKQLFIPLTGLALISLASPSYAGDNQGIGWDYKTQPGAACQPHIGAQAGDFERYTNSIRNASDTDHRVICPIVRDTVTSTDLDIGVTVTTGVSCTFNTTNYKGDDVGQFDPSSTQGFDNGTEIQYFSVIPANPAIDSPGVAQGYYALQCMLPPSGRVFSYGSGELAESTDHGQ